MKTLAIVFLASCATVVSLSFAGSHSAFSGYIRLPASLDTQRGIQPKRVVSGGLVITASQNGRIRIALSAGALEQRGMLVISDVCGKAVRVINCRTVSSVPTTVDSRDAAGRPLSAGIYVARLDIGDVGYQQRFAVVKGGR